MGILRSQGMEDEVGYAYVACMAVDPPFRRQGAASELLAAAEAQVSKCGSSAHGSLFSDLCMTLRVASTQAGQWRQNCVLLHTYADNAEGLALYAKNGCVCEVHIVHFVSVRR